MSAHSLVAALGDVHGNLLALEAVLDDVDREKPDAIWFHGDLCFGGPRPRECAEEVRGYSNAVVLKGNTDAWLTAGPEEGPPGDEREAARRGTLASAREELGPDLLRWLEGLPTEHSDPGAPGALLTHASPGNIHGPFLLPEASDDEWREAFGTGPSLIVCGHVHVAYLRPVGPELLIANTGSIGAPFDADPRASYLLIRFGEEGAREFRFRRVEYDRERAAAEYERRGGPWGRGLAQTVRTGRPAPPAAPPDKPELQRSQFTGPASIHRVFGSRAALVQFEAGARTMWHRHAGQQLLEVLSGRGLLEREGAEAQLLAAGRIAHVPAETTHRHGANPDSSLVHLAWTAGETIWLEDEAHVPRIT
jgi:quercetin dioxygenase-like cupin family protein/diadenosine tetraphosphatase ApaH/serine/threonine PP2A family protein phosphatase